MLEILLFYFFLEITTGYQRIINQIGAIFPMNNMWSWPWLASVRLEKFEIGGFTLKTHRMFSVLNTPQEFENTTVTGHFGFVVEGNSVEKSHYFCDVVFGNPLFRNVFRPNENAKQAFSNSSGLMSVFEKLRVHGRLNRITKAAFSSFPGALKTGPESATKGIGS